MEMEPVAKRVRYDDPGLMMASGSSYAYPQQQQQQFVGYLPEQHHPQLQPQQHQQQLILPVSPENELPCLQQMITPQMIVEYLIQPIARNCTVVFAYPKAIQKSYGNEKRYACPNPRVELHGFGWNYLKNAICKMHNVDSNCMHFMGNLKIDEDFSVKLIGQDGVADTFGFEQKYSTKVGFYGAQSLRTCTLSTRQFTTMKLGIELAGKVGARNDFGFGKLTTHRMKIVSKPSKSKKAIDKAGCQDHISVRSGSKVAFYSRSKAQTQTTRHMAFDEATCAFTSDTSYWSVFDIYAVEEGENPQTSQFSFIEGNITYGSFIRLVHCETGYQLPVMRIRRVTATNSKSSAGHVLAEFSVSGDEPVSQMHACALELFVESKGGEYLCPGGSIKGPQVSPCVRKDAIQTYDNYSHVVDDTFKWTIVSVENDSYTFAPLVPNPHLAEPIMPCPFVERISTNRINGRLWIEAIGTDFRQSISVWIGSWTSLDTMTNFRSTNCILSVLPTTEEYTEHCLKHQIDFPDIQNGQDLPLLPVLLVRQDGIVYRTKFVYKFNTSGRGGLPGQVIEEPRYSTIGTEDDSLDSGFSDASMTFDSSPNQSVVNRSNSSLHVEGTRSPAAAIPRFNSSPVPQLQQHPPPPPRQELQPQPQQQQQPAYQMPSTSQPAVYSNPQSVYNNVYGNPQTMMAMQQQQQQQQQQYYAAMMQYQQYAQFYQSYQNQQIPQQQQQMHYPPYQ